MDRYLKESDVNAALKQICDDTATTYGIEHGGRAERFARLTENIPSVNTTMVEQTNDDIMELIKNNAERSVIFCKILYLINKKDRQIKILRARLSEELEKRLKTSSGSSTHQCKYCGEVTSGSDENVLCDDCAATFGHRLFSEL